MACPFGDRRFSAPASGWEPGRRARSARAFFAALEQHQMAALAAHGLGRLSKSGSKENRGQPVVSMSLLTCACCGAFGAKACKACGTVRYCSEQCQKARSRRR